MLRKSADNFGVKKNRAGIVGAGVFGGYHAQKYAVLHNVVLTSVFDTDRRRAEALADRFQADVYTDYLSFLESVDLVSITTPATTHFTMAREALSKAKHCLVEKPIALRTDHAEALIRQADASGVRLQVGHQERLVANAAGLFDDTACVTNATWRRCGMGTGRCEDVSVVFDLMIHDLDLARQFGVGEPISIHASGDENDVSATLRFADGRRFEFVASRRSPVQDRSMVLDYGDKTKCYDFTMKNSAVPDPLMMSIQSFVSAIETGGPVAITGRDGLNALNWACAIEEAWRASESRLQEAVA